MPDLPKLLTRIQGLAGKLEANHSQVVEMMRLMVQDNLRAMAYGQYGGSTPNPTQNAVIAPDGSTRMWARDNQAEADLAAYSRAIEEADRQLGLADDIRRKHMSANLDIRNRLDPSEFCVVHWPLHLYEGHRRTKGPLCKICGLFYDENKREPTATEADYYHRHGRWPHKLFDPKARKAV